MRYATRAEYREAWSKAVAETPPVPLNLDIELASVCDLRCPFCFIPNPAFEKMIREKSQDGRPRARMMPKAMALRLIDQAAEIGIPALKFNWRGESTLHPDYSEILNYARASGAFHDILINSNFNFAPRSMAGVLSATKAMVSLDSCRPETHAKMRVGADYNRVIANIKEALTLKHPNLWLRRVVTKDNIGEPFFDDCRRLFGEFGKYHVSEHMVFDRNFNINSMPGHAQEPLEREYCTYPSVRLVVSSAGLVMPCCIALYENLIVGDTNKQSLLEIWESDKMRELRATLKAGNVAAMPEACRGCESWMAYKSPYRSMVNDVEIKSPEESIFYGAKAGQ